MQRSVECPVCVDIYATRSRIPKLLTCGHGVCEQCLIQITTGKVSVECPKCRTVCMIPEGKPENLPTNYPILELLDTLCGNCFQSPHIVKCSHCTLNVCDGCRYPNHKTHASEESHNDLTEMKVAMVELSKMMSNEMDIQSLQVREDQAMIATNEAWDDHLKQIQQKREAKLNEIKASFKQTKEHLLDWRANARRLFTECDILLEKATYNEQYKETNDSEGSSVKSQIKLVKDMMKSKPVISEANIKFNVCLLDKDNVESKFTQTISAKTVSCQTQTASNSRFLNVLMPDYTTARYKASFENQMVAPAAVCVSPNSGNIIATDLMKDVVFELTPNLEIVHTLGRRGAGPNEYNNPRGVVVESHNLFISDIGNNRIHVVCPEGKDLFTFGSKGLRSECMKKPRGLAMDREGNLFVCDTGNKRILVVDRHGNYIREFGKDIFNCDPWYIAISADERVAVTEGSGHKIYLFDINGRHINTIKTSNNPLSMVARGVAFDDYGNLLVADASEGRVVVLQDNAIIASVGRPGSAKGQLRQPWDVAVTNDGNLVICDKENGRLQLFHVPKKSVQLPVMTHE